MIRTIYPIYKTHQGRKFFVKHLSESSIHPGFKQPTFTENVTEAKDYGSFPEAEAGLCEIVNHNGRNLSPGIETIIIESNGITALDNANGEAAPMLMPWHAGW